MTTSKLIRKVSFLCCILFLFQVSGFTQKKLSASQWQSDLAYLQNKIHKEYPNLFHNVQAKQFDSAVAVLHKQIPHISESEIRVGFARLIAMFKIGHTMMNFSIGENEDSLVPMFHFLPITINLFSDGLYIQQADTTYRSSLGGRVIKIGDSSVEDVLKKMHEVIPCENEQYFKSHLHYYLRFPEILQAFKFTDAANAINITYIKDGVEKKIKVIATDCPAYAWYDGIFLPKGWVDAYENFNKPASSLWLKEPRKLRYFEYLKDSKTVYVRHIAVVERGDETISDFFEKTFRFIDSNDVDKFVLDIRMNGGGNNYLNKPVIQRIIESKKINRYGHLFIIIGAATFSAAQNLTNELEKYTEAIFVGEPTAENVNFWGDVKNEILPLSGTNVKLSWLWWQNLDPRDKRQWTAPNLATSMSFENYKSGFDSAMSIIQNFKEEKRIEDKIKEFITNGNSKEAIQAVKDYLEDPLYRYCKYELEEKINDMAYSLVMRRKLEEASHFFWTNVQCFPNSANVYDSYAECMYYMGNKDEAIKYYEIAVSKDPQGPSGQNSKKMLALIKGK